MEQLFIEITGHNADGTPISERIPIPARPSPEVRVAQSMAGMSLKQLLRLREMVNEAIYDAERHR